MEDRTVCDTIALPAIASLFMDFNESERVKNRCKGQVWLVIGLKKKNAKKKEEIQRCVATRASAICSRLGERMKEKRDRRSLMKKCLLSASCTLSVLIVLKTCAARD